MKFLAEFIIRLTDLLEAEGRLAKRGFLELFTAGLILLCGATLITLGAVSIAVAGFYTLLYVMKKEAALMLVGGALTAVGLVCAIVGRSLAARQPPTPRPPSAPARQP